ncbi:Uncharacterized conserved protein PhnB, glyoxalase superfamily [Fodinibius roseus]|uniref:Uncharacterized conserved protein PhnB, glyoxalase superfamily n=1 Tax=Fodinibius roseus TaxID=1194090 RepID=A0A1M5BH15_9BACT|nr:VOC family protein [Fodinibius roseus]SHF41759.1 Uncharacterized conserved protein PhnB, glyoxalase superfamily [Fodinibius roseus]
MKKTTIRYIVDDVESAIDFYTNLLGFELRMHPAPGFAALEKEGLRLLLNQPGAGGAGQDMPDGQSPEPGGWNRMQLEVDDLASFYADLQEKGGSFRNDIVEGEGGKQVLLLDPSGNPIELFEPAREKAVRPIPEGYHTITPYLIVDGAQAFIDFLQEAFNAQVESMMKSDDGLIRHSALRIGDSHLMVSSSTKDYPPTTFMLHLYVRDVDATYEQAIGAGGASLREPTDEFYGDRSAGIRDQWDNQWWMATHIEDVSEEELKRREQEMSR